MPSAGEIAVGHPSHIGASFLSYRPAAFAFTTFFRLTQVNEGHLRARILLIIIVQPKTFCVAREVQANSTPRERSQLTAQAKPRTARPRFASGISCTARGSGPLLGFGQIECS